MRWGFDLPPPELGGPDPSDPEFEFGVLIVLVIALLVALPIWWLILIGDN